MCGRCWGCQLLRFGIAALMGVLALAACSDIPLSGGPGPVTRKETGPLTIPPAGVMSGQSM
jgi:hypothetical protein